MTMAMLDLAAKLAMPESTLPGTATAPTGEDVASGFGDLLQALVGDGAKRQGGDDEAGEPGDGHGAEQSTASSVSNPLALPLPQLQAALATAISGFAFARAEAATGGEEPTADVERDIMMLSRLVARKASEADGKVLQMPSDDTLAMPDTAPALQAWLNGPYAAAAPQTGAREARPMNLAVLSVATHFAPVTAVSESPMVANVTDGAAVTGALQAQLAPDVNGNSAAPASDDVLSSKDATASNVSTSAVAMPVADQDATAGRQHEQRGGRQDAPDLAADADVGDVAQATDVARPTEVPASNVTAPPARQVGEEVARALAGGGAPPSAAHGDTRPAPGKLKVLHIQLQPESLGTVTVRMEIKVDVLELRIDAVRAETADLIQRDREVLSSLIRSAGYSADDASIRVTHGDASMAVLAASSSDGTSTGSGQGTAGDRSAHSHGRESGERRGEQQRQSGRGHSQDGAADRDERELYL